MKKSILYIIILCCSSFLTLAQPTITSFTPTSGPIGTEVTITGTNFDTTPANNIVFFGATQANVSAATTTILTVTVPAGPTYQPITVLTNELLAYSNAPFVVTFIGDGRGIIDNNSYEGKVDITTGTEPNSVTIGDLDGDGKADLVVANSGSNIISVFRNIGIVGSISYAAKVEIIIGTSPRSVSIGDLPPTISTISYLWKISNKQKTGSTYSLRMRNAANSVLKVAFLVKISVPVVVVGENPTDGLSELPPII